jgi:hypothetical protein
VQSLYSSHELGLLYAPCDLYARAMSIGPLAGYQVAHVTCRACRHVARLDPVRVPVGTQLRLRCRVCGARGADIQYVWTVEKPPGNVVAFRGRKGK